MPDGAVAGVILTGGRSMRMGGVTKAHQMHWAAGRSSST